MPSKNFVEGLAAQILWQISDTATEEQVLELLRYRFGHINQAERFRAEMSMRRRKPGELVQELYNEIRRLLALSFSGESGGLYDIIGRDAFLASLDDPAMRVKALELQPSFMDDALTIVCRLQAYLVLNSLDKSAETNPAVEDRKRVRVVKPDKSVFFDTGADRDKAMERRFKQMEGDLAAQKRELRQLSADAQQWKDRAIAAEQKAQAFYPPSGH